MLRSLVGSEMCIRDRVSTQSTGFSNQAMPSFMTYLLTTYGWKRILYTTSVLGLALAFFIASRLRHRRNNTRPQQIRNNTAAVAPPPAAKPDNKSREVVCAGNEVLFEQIEGSVRFVPGAEGALGELCDKFVVYIVTMVENDESCEGIQQLLAQTLVPRGLDMRRVLFCSTLKGRESIARQILPSVHIDSDLTVLGALQPYLGAVWHVQPAANSTDSIQTDRNMSTAQSLRQLVAHFLTQTLSF
eukprot:TRINITY_DN6783_c0_g1_i2.p1 TRINITY_DN6783_c0_g1~~TRINITY_DN6783_c0_g1_i2.p1  ORF type:complete len:274 (-),score=69.63 TRINITY_DN6783_c0_g1_i2:226-957(-)